MTQCSVPEGGGGGKLNKVGVENMRGVRRGGGGG